MNVRHGLLAKILSFCQILMRFVKRLRRLKIRLARRSKGIAMVGKGRLGWLCDCGGRRIHEVDMSDDGTWSIWEAS